MLFTPEMATEIINKPSTNFRSVKQPVVKQYVKDMLNGNWTFCGDSIKFDKDGNLIDGQHRLRAIIKSGIPQYFYKVEELDPESARVMDSGFKRSVNDYLKSQSAAYETGAASIIRQVEILKKKSKYIGHSTANNGTSYSDVVDLYENDTEWYNKAAIYGKKISKESARTLKQTEVGAIYYYLVRIMGVDADYVEDFFFKLCNSSRNERSIYNTTMISLNNENYIRRSGVKRIVEFINCWNAMVHGCTTLRKKYSDWFEKPVVEENKNFVMQYAETV